MKFKNKVVVVTGGGSGIGEAAAKKFAAEGARVAILGRRKFELDRVADSIAKAGGEALALETDAASESQLENSMDQILQKWSALDFAFNNAGILGVMAPIAEMNVADYDETFRINTRGVWLCIRAEVRAMLKLKVGGSIVNTSSFVAQAPNAGASAYAASKAALDAMIKSVALEVGPA
ncbi:MAG: SDR family NAD(P)-dependent oxidoreductase, partial [Proteobacteria bacterium]